MGMRNNKQSSLISIKNLRLNGFYITRLLCNPFYLYIVTLTVGLLLYQLGWSNNSPNLTIQLYLFFSFTIVIALFFGYKLNLISNLKDSIEIRVIDIRYLYVITLINVIVFAITFILNGVPAHIILFTEQSFNHLEFQVIPFLTITSLTLNAYCILSFFLIVLVQKKAIHLPILIVTVIPIVLFFNRSYAFVSFLPLFFVFFFAYWRKYLSHFFILIVMSSFLFGIVGDFRQRAKDRTENKSMYEYFIGANYPKWLPTEFFWGYFYITSPIAKFQYIITDAKINTAPSNISALVVHEFFPNSIGYRLATFLDISKQTSEFGMPDYFVGTCFGGVYIYGRWCGLFVYTIIFFSFIFFVMHWIVKSKKNTFFLVSCIMCVFTVLSIFSNMLIYIPLQLLLIWVVLFDMIASKYDKYSVIPIKFGNNFQ